MGTGNNCKYLNFTEFIWGREQKVAQEIEKVMILMFTKQLA